MTMETEGKKGKKKSSIKGEPAEELSYEDKAAQATLISQPMANKKLSKKLYKLIKKAHKEKYHLWNGLKMVQLKIRKGETGIIVMGGNASPMDVICHMPAVCEDRGIPYVFVPTGKDLGVAMGVRRSSLLVLIKPGSEYQELYDEVLQEIKALPPVVPV